MIHFNLLEHGMWSAPTFGDSLWKTASSGNAWWVRSNPELTKLIKRHRNEVAEITPKILDAKINSNFTKNKAAWAGSINNKFYEETYFSIVVETDFSDKKHKVNRYTEKTYKCFPMMHPFIVAGNPFVLKNLREDGFKTFHPHIDESYDKMCNFKDRMNAIMKEARRLCGLSTSEWDRLLNDLAPILLHNKKVAAKAPMIKTNINNIIT